MQLTDDETAELTSGGSTQPRPPMANSTPPAPNPPTPPPRPAAFNIPLVENSKWLDEDVEPVPMQEKGPEIGPDIPKAHSTRFKPKGATAADPSPPPPPPPGPGTQTPPPAYQSQDGNPNPAYCPALPLHPCQTIRTTEKGGIKHPPQPAGSQTGWHPICGSQHQRGAG